MGIRSELRGTIFVVAVCAAATCTVGAAGTTYVNERSFYAARWISGDTLSPEKPAPVLFREFALGVKPTNAVFTVAVAGWCEVYVNGEKVGRDVLSPVTCQPDKRLSSVDYDVAPFLKKGENAVEVLLGNGWFNCFTKDVWGFSSAPWLGAPKVCGELVADGKTLLVTDGSWTVRDSPIVFNALRNGEYYDARREGIHANVRAVKVEAAPSMSVSPEDAVPCRTFDPILPVRSFPAGNGGTIYDFGSNRTGWCEIEVVGEAGSKVTIDYDECLTPTNTLLGDIGIFIRKNKDPRPAQHDEYTLAGKDGGERWHPRFTYHGFRYVQVRTEGKVELKSIKSVFVHSDFASVGSFKISDPVFGKLQDATRRSYLSNFTGIPTDCPHREKNGWTGDAQLAMETGHWNFDAKAGYIHFLRMMIDAQKPDGKVPRILPSTDKFGYSQGSGPAWDAILFEVPWQIYRFYGDDATAREAYPAMKKYLSFIAGKAREDGLVKHGLGDWCAPTGVKVAPVLLTDSAYVYEFNRRVAFWAERFGEGDVAAECRKKAAKVKASFNREFYKGGGVYAEGELTSLAAPLYFKGLCADGEERKVIGELLRRLRENGHKAMFGILGAKWVPRVLADYGYIDDAWRIFTQPDAPGWAIWMKDNDTLLESFDDRAGGTPVSHNHIMFGDLSAWAFEYIAGIKIDDPGFAKFHVEPHLPDGVESFEASFRTPCGRKIVVRAWREGGKAKYDTAANDAACPAKPARKQKSYDDMTWWDPYVENITDSDTYIRRKFRQDVTDRSTGVGVDGLKKMLAEIVADGKASGESWRITKAKCFAAQVEKQSIDVLPLDWFPAIAVWDRNDRPISGVFRQRASEVNAKSLPAWVTKEWHAGNKDGTWTMWQDFDHSVPDWRVIMKLGFPGMKERLKKYAVKGDPFYDGLEIAMDAMLAGIDRFIAQARKNISTCSTCSTRLKKEIACLERLRNGPPQTAYDMMMFVWLYFFWSEHLDGIQCRSLTELDVFLTPYYDADIAAGRTTEAEFREQLKHFLWQWGSVANYWNQPVGFGGTRADGTSEFNHVSKIILEVMDECALPTPKFLVKIAPNTPDWAFDKMLDMARRRRSIAFIGEEPAARALKRWRDVSDEDCRTMVVLGCYEFGLRDSVNGTGVGHVNFLKPVEKILEECKVESAKCKVGGEPLNSQLATFDSFKTEYLRRLAHNTARCREIAFEFEKVLPEVNPANLMTLSTEHALKTHRDGFANGCPRGNTSTVLAVGPGTTVDALLAVKEIVYERKEMTLAELGKVMAANWKGHEELRLRMLRSKRKWGNNDPEANALGAELIATFAEQLNGKPNSKGGSFRASGHCARQFVVLGAKTGATPDGRKKGEEMSKNLSPTMGADTEGATALISTLAASDVTTLPGDYPLDMMLHPSVCAGEKGIQTMKALVRQFHKNGGSVIQFTVFSAEELRDAQAHPEKYENLQVRVCGWNVRWNDLSKAEQDAYICRAENVRKLSR